MFIFFLLFHSDLLVFSLLVVEVSFLFTYLYKQSGRLLYFLHLPLALVLFYFTIAYCTDTY